MVDRNDSLLREVEEELRREQLEKLWQKYGTYALLVAVLIVAGIGGSKWLEARRQAAAEAAGSSYHAALAAMAGGKAEEAKAAFAGIAKGGAPGYADLAELRLAGVALKDGRTADALKGFEAVAADSSAEGLLRGFAQLQAASLRLAEADFTEMQNRLNALTGADSAWRGNALELLGVAALKAGRTAEARQTFEKLMGERAIPPSIVERARTYMALIAAAELAQQGAAGDGAGKADAKADAAKPDGGKTDAGKSDTGKSGAGKSGGGK